MDLRQIFLRVSEKTEGFISRLTAGQRIAVAVAGVAATYALLRSVLSTCAKDLKNEVVFLTGGGMGIGRRMALRLASAGAKVAIADVNWAAAQTVASEVAQAGGAALPVHCDVADYQSVRAAAETVRREWGDPTILINNAGIVSGKKFMESSVRDMERTIQVNTVAHLYTIKELLPSMVAKDHGHIVTIASLCGHIGVAGLVDYAASKFAAVGLTEALRSELKLVKSSVKTTCVNPGYINTGMFDGATLYNRVLLPVLDEDYVAQRVVQAVRHNTEVLILPGRAAFTLALKGILPAGVVDSTLSLLCLNNGMDTFKGRV